MFGGLFWSHRKFSLGLDLENMMDVKAIGNPCRLFSHCFDDIVQSPDITTEYRVFKSLRNGPIA